jgi:hypothetical protein
MGNPALFRLAWRTMGGLVGIAQAVGVAYGLDRVFNLVRA